MRKIGKFKLTHIISGALAIVLFIVGIVLLCKNRIDEPFDRKQVWFKGSTLVSLIRESGSPTRDDSNIFVIFHSLNVTVANLCSLESAALHHPYSKAFAVFPDGLFPNSSSKSILLRSHTFVQLKSNYNNLYFGINQNLEMEYQLSGNLSNFSSLLSSNGGTLLDSTVILMKPIRDVSLVLKTDQNEMDFSLLRLRSEDRSSVTNISGQSAGVDVPGLSFEDKSAIFFSINDVPLPQTKLDKMILQTTNEALGLKLNGNETLSGWKESRIFLQTRHWWDRIDENIILGALPLRGETSRIIARDEQVRAVISMNETYELKYLSNRGPEWEKLGVPYFLQLATTDFSQSPTQEKLCQGVKFINEVLTNDSKSSIYVHCKAGRTRSATLVACYLMSKHRWNPGESVAFIREKRPHIRLHSKQLESLDKFYEDNVLLKDDASK